MVSMCVSGRSGGRSLCTGEVSGGQGKVTGRGIRLKDDEDLWVRAREYGLWMPEFHAGEDRPVHMYHSIWGVWRGRIRHERKQVSVSGVYMSGSLSLFVSVCVYVCEYMSVSWLPYVCVCVYMCSMGSSVSVSSRTQWGRLCLCQYM